MPSGLIHPLLYTGSIHLCVELAIADVHLPGVDPYDGPYPDQQRDTSSLPLLVRNMHTILLMHPLNFKHILPRLDNIVVELNPTSQCRKLRSRKLGQGGEIEAVYGQESEIHEQ